MGMAGKGQGGEFGRRSGLPIDKAGEERGGFHGFIHQVFLIVRWRSQKRK
jgi:hypothetical protein